MTAPGQYASVRYVVDDMQAAGGFYTTHPGFTLNTSAAAAFADVARGSLRLLLLSGPASSGGRQIPLADPAGHLTEPFQPARRPASPAEAS